LSYVAAYVTLLASAERTVDVTGNQITVWEKYQAAHIVVDITTGGSNLIATVKGRDTASGKDYTILTSTTMNASGTTVLRVGPDYTAGANTAKDYMPYNFHVDITQSGGTPVTYSVGASLI
jgi:hypothetical protein